MNRIGQRSQSGYSRNNSSNSTGGTSSSQYGAFYRQNQPRLARSPQPSFGKVNLKVNAGGDTLSKRGQTPQQRGMSPQISPLSRKFVKSSGFGSPRNDSSPTGRSTGGKVWSAGTNSMDRSVAGFPRGPNSRVGPQRVSVRHEVNDAITTTGNLNGMSTNRGGLSSRGGDQRPNTANFNPRVECGADSIKNTGKDRYNQDKYIGENNTAANTMLLGVFDGHGEDGHNVADQARIHLTECVKAPSFHKERDLKRAMHNAITEMKARMQSRGHCNTQHSGSTAVAVLKHQNKLIMANIGDSRAVLGRLDPGTSGHLTAVDLTKDHKCDDPVEAHRLNRMNARVHQSLIPQYHGGLQPMGPMRVWDKAGMHGVAMSRSLGDDTIKPYLSDEPEITSKRLDSADKIVILGSDGIWDSISSQEAVDIASKHKKPSSAAKELTQIARARWHARTNGQLADDITAVVATLHN